MPRPLTLPFALDLPNRAVFPWKDGPHAAVTPGLNFAALDPLSLRSAPIRTAPADPAEAAGLLPRRLARFLHQPVARTFATGPDAIRQTLAALLDASDEVILDAGCDPAMFETVRLVAARRHRCPPGSVEGVERRLARLSRQPGHGRLVVIVPAISRLASVAADLAELVALCARHDALLIVDVTRDLGAIGPCGQGMVEVQGCLGRVDVLLGDLAGPFAAPGGFAAFRDPCLADRLRGDAPSPSAAAALLAALDGIDSREGARRRRVLHASTLRLRNHLMGDGLHVMGQPSPVVPVLLPRRKAEAFDALLHSAGPEVPLLRAPEVAGHAPRWHIRLTAGHGPADIDNLADLLRDITRAVDRPAHAPRALEPIPQP